MKKKIEIEYACKSCGSTGLYVGMGEGSGAAVVCNGCNGTGKAVHKFEYEEFDKRKERKDVRRVYQTNPGIGIGENDKVKLEDFGGMPYAEWLKGKPFKAGMESRKFVCPAWWYHSADYKKMPKWMECNGGVFPRCTSFATKDKCWERWDKEFGKKGK